MVSEAHPMPGVPAAAQPRARVMPHFTVREWLVIGAVALVVLVVTGLPYAYAYRIAPPDTRFMGVAVNIPDHYQYFSWMRESWDKVLVPNQMTPEPSTPLLFNFLWWTLGRVQAATGLDTGALYQLTRLLAGAFAMTSIYFFGSVVFTNRAKRFTAFLVGVLGSGLGWVWVVEKYLSNLPGVRYPFDVFTAEPNTFYTIMGFPHFTIATGLIALIFALTLLAQRSQNLRYSWAAAAVTLLLSVQHAYDMFTIYGVIGLYGLFIWLRDRRFPLFLFKTGVIIVLVSVWPALQAFLITNADPVWKGVLEQFDNAGAWTPGPLNLPILMGLGWLLAIWALDIRTPWRDRDDTHLFVLAWFLAHFVLIYLPFNFQIHLLSGWQVVIGVLATIGLYRRVLPWLARRLPRVSRTRLVWIASTALVLVVLPTNVYLLAQRFLDIRRAQQFPLEKTAGDTELSRSENLLFLLTEEVEALNYLATRAASDDVVFASLEIGQFVPALTGARAFLAHWAQTLDFYGKRDMVRAFFDGATDDAERRRILADYSVDYLIYSPEEAKLGAYDPAEAPYLVEIFRDGPVVVYQVDADLMASG